VVAEAFSGVFWMRPVFWVTVAFVVFFVLFGRRIWGIAVAALDARGEAIRRELAEATQLRREAEALLADARSRREAAIADAKRVLESAQAEATRVAAAMAADAEASAQRRERMALDRIAAAEQAAVHDVRIAAAEVATAAAQQVIAAGLTPEADAGLIDQAIAGLPAALRAA